MAGPEDWGAVPAGPENQDRDGPAAWGAVPAERALPWETAKPGQEQGSWSEVPAAIGTYAKGVAQGIWGLLQLPGEEWEAGLKGEPGVMQTPEGQEQAVNLAALITGLHKTPTRLPGGIAPIVKAFDEGVGLPAAQRLDSYARAGDPNGVRLESSAPETKPAPITPIQDSPSPPVPRSVAARTGDPVIDAVLDHPTIKAVIDNPVIDDTHTIPNSWGGSLPLNRPVTYRDKDFPKTLTVPQESSVAPGTVRLYRGEQDWGPYPNPAYKPRAQFWTTDPERAKDYGANSYNNVRYIDVPQRELEQNFSKDFKGDYQTGDVDFKYHSQARPIETVTFDTAEPAILHENTEEFVMGKLTAAGWDNASALKAAFWGWGQPIEHAWYQYHGIDPAKVEAIYKPILDRIATREADNIPPDLFKKTYPGGDPLKDTAGQIPKPTHDELVRAREIIRNDPDLQPRSAQPMLQEARELGVIGPEKPSLNELPPQDAGKAVMPPRPPGAPEQGPPRPEQTAWRKRWETTLDKMATRDDVRQVIGGIVDANDEFAAARIGDMRPVQIEQIASVTGLDSTKIDVGGTSSKIKSDVELRNFTEAFRTINDKIAAAADELRAKRGVDDEAEGAELMRLELQRQLMLDSTVAVKGLVALRAEWGRAGNALQEFYKAQREAEGAAKVKGIDDLRERAKLIGSVSAADRPRVLILSPYKPMPWYFWATQQLLISGPVTHTAYSAVNTGEIMLDHVIAPLGQELLNKVRGQPASLGAPLEAYNAIVRSVPEAFKGAVAAFKSGVRVPLKSEWELAKRQIENPEAEGAQVPYTSTSGPDWGIWKRAFNDEQLAKAEKVIGVFGRSANAQHTFFKIMGEKAATAAEAYRAAGAEGLAPSLTDNAANAKFWERYQYHTTNLSDEALTKVIDSAYEGTFMEKLGEQTRVFAELARNTPLKWVFMFTHIPMNIARAGVRYSWMAAGTLPFESSKIGSALRGELGVQAQNLALVKASIGTAVGTYFIHKALNGEATGDYPTDEKERNRWKDLGIQPNSIALDGQWHSLERLGPVMGAVPRLAANYAAIIKQYEGGQDESLMKAAWLMALGTAKVVTDDVGFQTIRNIVNALENPKEAAKEMTYQLASYVDPFTMGAQAASEIDPFMREADTVMQGIMMRLPFAREELLPKRDPIYGEPLPNPGYHAAPFRSAPINTDPVKAELDRLKYYPTAPEKTIGGVKLTDAQYDRYEATAGPLVKQMLQAAVNGPNYARLPDGAKQATLKAMVTAGRARARAAMQADDPTLLQQGIDAKKARLGL